MESATPESDLPDTDEPVGGARPRRELLILGSGLLAGFVVVPLLIWSVGHSLLGPYSHGGPGKLLGDFLTGLAHGSPIFWAVALGPYLLSLLVRFLYSQLRPRR